MNKFKARTPKNVLLDKEREREGGKGERGWKRRGKGKKIFIGKKYNYWPWVRSIKYVIYKNRH